MDEPEFHAEIPVLDLDFYRGGGSKLSDSEREILGEVTGVRVLVTPEGSGDEVLSLLNLGAEVTVYRPVGTSVQEAVAALDRRAEFVVGSLGDMPPDEIRGRTFQLVYSPWGTIDGLADLETWARDVGDFLEVGGRFVVYDEHPVSFMVGEQGGQLVVTSSYWGEFIDEDNDGEPDESDFAPTTFGWAIGDLVTALGNAGLAVTRLEEFQESDRYLTALELVENISDEQRAMLPAALLLVAVKL
jgi:hypothetical protein